MKKNLLFLLKQCHSKKNALFLAVIFFNIIGAVLEGTSYFFMISAFNVLSKGTSKIMSHIDFLNFLETKNFVFIIFLALCSQVLKSAFCFAGASLNAHLAMHLQKTLQMKIHKQIFRLSYSCIHRYNRGQLLSYAQSPHNFVRHFLEKFNHIIVAFFLITASLAIMCILSLPLTLFTLLLFAIAACAQKGLFKMSAKVSSQLTNEMETSNSLIIQHLAGIKIIHLFNQQANLLNNISQIFKKFGTLSKKLLTLNALINAINEVMGTIVVSSCLVVGFWAFSKQNAQPLSLLLGFITVAYRLSGKVLGAMDHLSNLAALKGPLEQMTQILQNTDKEFLKEQGHLIPKLDRVVQFENVSFQYPGTQNPVLSNFSCKIPKGQVIAIVGASGAGKSTILDLLGGLYEPTQGEILIDGIPLSRIDLFSWREKLAYVNQDTILFQDSIENNIRMGRKEASEEEVVQAAVHACAHSFITKLESGYKTHIGEQGYRLSGGEKQRIALARALIRKAEIIVLDEATSHLDYHSESMVQATLHESKELFQKITWIIIAHRLSTIIHADTILVMEKGQIKEMGTHDKLLSLGGLYTQLWNSHLQNQ